MPEDMRALDGYLSRQAQLRLLDRSALVYREPDGTYTLERKGEDALSIGENFGSAKDGIVALQQARRARE